LAVISSALPILLAFSSNVLAGKPLTADERGRYVVGILLNQGARGAGDAYTAQELFTDLELAKRGFSKEKLSLPQTANAMRALGYAMGFDSSWVAGMNVEKWAQSYPDAKAPVIRTICTGPDTGPSDIVDKLLSWKATPSYENLKTNKASTALALAFLETGLYERCEDQGVRVKPANRK
jgi:hypothetical protein